MDNNSLLRIGFGGFVCMTGIARSFRTGTGTGRARVLISRPSHLMVVCSVA